MVSTMAGTPRAVVTLRCRLHFGIGSRGSVGAVVTGQRLKRVSPVQPLDKGDDFLIVAPLVQHGRYLAHAFSQRATLLGDTLHWASSLMARSSASQHRALEWVGWAFSCSSQMP